MSSFVSRAIALGVIALTAAGCGPAGTTSQPTNSAAGPTAGPVETDPGVPSAAPTVAAEGPCGADRVLGPDGEVPLAAGTYAWDRPRLGIEFPTICFTVPDGWTSDARFTRRARGGQGPAPVAMMFWDVGRVYGKSCQWVGTLFDPGPSVEDLARALVEVPRRNATEPTDVSLGGYTGKYLEWSVPAYMDVDEQGDFVTCDVDPNDGQHYYESWSGDPAGWGGDRYQQGPGQLDRLWILDVDGVRFVIDAFSMPSATEEEIDELLAVVHSITFER